MMALTPEQKRRLIQAANQERVDPGELIREAEAMANGEPSDEKKAIAERLLIGFLPWVKVRELRERLGFTDRIPGDDELCTAFGVKRGFLAPPRTSGNDEDA